MSLFHRVNGRLLHYEPSRGRHATAILFLHGVLRNGRTFAPLLAGLAGEFGVTTLDFRGHGKSDWTPDAYRVLDYVEDAVAMLRMIDHPRLLLYGHSLGGMVAMAAAAREPERVRGIILEDPPFSTMGERLAGTDLARYFAGVRECVHAAHTPQEIFEHFSEIVVGAKPDGSPLRVRDQRDETARRFMSECLAQIDHTVLDPIVAGEWLAGYDLAAIARQVRCPTLLLQSDAACGGMLRDDDLATITGILGPLAQVHRFPGAGHQLHSTRTAEVVELIRHHASG